MDIRPRFNTVLGHTYQVENADVISGPWGVLSNNIPGHGSAKQAQDVGD